MIALDTDVLVDLLRQFSPAMAWLGSLGDAPVIVPGFVVMELIQGCRTGDEQRRIERFIDTYDVAWPTSTACDAALATFRRFHLSHSIGVIDALIGHTAVERGLPLHTFNQRHYALIPDLQTVQPYRKDSPAVL